MAASTEADLSLRRPILALAAPLGGCSGAQSAFAPCGAEAASLRTLAIVMFSAAAVITAAMLSLARVRRRAAQRLAARSRRLLPSEPMPMIARRIPARLVVPLAEYFEAL